MNAGSVDLHILEHKFNVVLTKREQPVFSVRGEDLLHSETMLELLQTYKPLIKADETTAPAAYFCGFLSMLGLALQYSVSIWNKSFDVTLSNLTIQLYTDRETGYSRFAFVIHPWSDEAAPSDCAARDEWRERILSSYYEKTARPIIECASQVSGLDAGQLWGQFPTRMNYFLDVFHQEIDESIAGSPESSAAISIGKNRLTDDYDCLRSLSGSIFGRTKNPLDVKIRYIEDSRNPDKQVKMKNACCLYYKTGEGQYCYTCPRLNESDREAIRAKYRALDPV
jgi:ferric iron reductase protein FhuF